VGGLAARTVAKAAHYLPAEALFRLFVFLLVDKDHYP